MIHHPWVGIEDWSGPDANDSDVSKLRYHPRASIEDWSGPDANDLAGSKLRRINRNYEWDPSELQLGSIGVSGWGSIRNIWSDKRRLYVCTYIYVCDRRACLGHTHSLSLSLSLSLSFLCVATCSLHYSVHISSVSAFYLHLPHHLTNCPLPLPQQILPSFHPSFHPSIHPFLIKHIYPKLSTIQTPSSSCALLYPRSSRISSKFSSGKGKGIRVSPRNVIIFEEQSWRKR